MLPSLLILLFPCSLFLGTELASKATKKPAPIVSMKRWSDAIIGGSSDATGKEALVVLARNIVLLSGIAPGKEPAKHIIARPQDGQSMGYGWLSPDARHGAIMDDMRVMSIVALGRGGPTSLTGRYMANNARFTPDSTTVLWWRSESSDRGRYTQPEGLATQVALCTIYSMRLDTTEQTPLKTTLPSCRNILQLSRDGKYAVVGDGGQQHSLSSYSEHLHNGEPLALDIQEDSYARFYRVELATGQAELLGQHELLRTSSSEDARVVCGNEPAGFQSEGPARVICLQRGNATTYTIPAADDPTHGWRQLSVSPDGRWVAVSLRAGPLATQPGWVHVLALDNSTRAPLLSDQRDASTLRWLPGGRRLFASPDNAPAMLHDLEAGWSVQLGESGQEVSGLIPLGAQDDRFLVGVERKNTRDMWMVELGNPGPKKSP